MKAFLVIAALALGGLAWGGPKTGGSFGGSNFRSGSSSGSRSYGSGSSGGSSFHVSGGSYRYSGGSSSSYSGSGPGSGTAVVFGVIVVVFAVIILVGWASSKSSDRVGVARGEANLAKIVLGIDWRQRKLMQAGLAQLAQMSDTSSAAGLAAAVRETVILLQRAQVAWIYAFDETRGLSMAQAEGAFNQEVSAARAKFEVDVVRGRGTAPAPELQARSDQGEGTVVVTLITCARDAMPRVADLHDARAIYQALAARTAVTGQTLLAFEVIWTPAVEHDRLSTAELTRVFPELVKIDPQSIAGRVVCEYCNGPYTAELIKCPHCGAAAPAQAARPQA